MRSVWMLCAALCFLSLAGCRTNYNKDSARTELNLANVDCGALWEKLWPQAKAGNLSARDALGELVMTRGLRIPGQPTDERWVDTYLNLVLHEDMMKNDTKRKFKLLGSDLVKQYAGSNVAYCFSTRWTLFTNAAQRSCVDDAVRDDLIMKFEDFVRSVEQHLQNGKSVTCSNQPFPQEF